MVVAAILLVAHLSRSSASAPILEILFNGSAALGFFLAGVLLTIVADAAITIPRVHYFRSSLTHDALDINEIEIFGPFTAEDGKVDWLIQTTPANAHEFRAAVCAAVRCQKVISYALHTCEIFRCSHSLPRWFLASMLSW